MTRPSLSLDPYQRIPGEPAEVDGTGRLPPSPIPPVPRLPDRPLDWPPDEGVPPAPERGPEADASLSNRST